ncbi:hypothetical protein K466DRAFT_582736 [Polyporus arcularius HHB13444]|uniref:Uncharacterized protein n=1 Tax=Polyporus arcularius HHB13444 TaxID=1314778 RepID=A0A5C3PSD7_9APHY|nr:hypothetical protein K466DRAFT_582736 [Polyporus arcularius HHB13444]
MSSSGPPATGSNGGSRTLSELAFAEPLVRKLASLAASNQPNSRLALLSCLADMTLREEFPDATPSVQTTTPSASCGPTGADRERVTEKWPQFESGECVRVAAESDPKSCQELTIADLKVFPRHIAADGCMYPVLTKVSPRVVKYIHSSRLHPTERRW